MNIARLGALLFAAGVMLFAGTVLAHDWYPYNCCSGHDCRRIDDTAVQLREGGFFIPESGETIGYADERVKRTPPEGGNFYHRCSRGGTPEGETICLYVPNFGA